MKFFDRTFIVSLILAVAAMGGTGFSQTDTKHKQIYSETADAHVEIKEALEKAKVEHKRVIVVFGANWCFDCHVLDEAFHRADLAAIIAANYRVVHVDIGKTESHPALKNQDLMEKYEVPMKRGIPGLAVLDPDGKLVYSQKNGEFENARAMSADDFLAFLNKWKPGA
ncbi:MAG: thioredoxin family protein [Terriglobales bacterium]|jgi:thiol:disulfide interchange protein